MGVELVKVGAEYRAITGGPQDREAPKAAGFRFGGDRTHEGKRFWFTTDVAKAEKLARYAKPDLAAQLNGAGVGDGEGENVEWARTILTCGIDASAWRIYSWPWLSVPMAHFPAPWLAQGGGTPALSPMR